MDAVELKEYIQYQFFKKVQQYIKRYIVQNLTLI